MLNMVSNLLLDFFAVVGRDFPIHESSPGWLHPGRPRPGRPRPGRQTTPRQATPRQTTPRQATPRQGTPRQILSRQANNQDVEAGLRRELTCERVIDFVIYLCIVILFISCFGLVISFILFACGVEQDPPKLFLFSFGFFLISSGLIGCLDKFQQSTH